MNIVTCLHCSNPIQTAPGPGKPPKFCSNRCKVAHSRATKKPTTPIQPTEKPLLISFPNFKPRPKASFKTPLDAYLPTQNDANIHAIIQGKPLPFPSHSAEPLHNLAHIPIPPAPTYDDQPTF